MEDPGVEIDPAAALALGDADDLGHQRSRLAHERPPRLQPDLDRPRQAGGALFHDRRYVARRGRGAGSGRHRHAAADVDHARLNAVAGELLKHADDDVERGGPGLRPAALRADVERHTGGNEAAPGGAPHERGGLGWDDPELLVERPVAALVGHHEPDGNLAARRVAGQLVDLGLGIEAEVPHAVLMRRVHEGRRLDGVAADDASGLDADLGHERKLGDAGDLEATAQTRQSGRHARVGVRLDRVEDRRAGEGRREAAIRGLDLGKLDDERRRRIDEPRGAFEQAARGSGGVKGQGNSGRHGAGSEIETRRKENRIALRGFPEKHFYR